MTRIGAALSLSLSLAACRYEVRLDDPPRDAGRRDAALPDAPRPDAPYDAPDAAARPCVPGVTVAPSPPTSPTEAPTLATTGTGEARRHALLLPPPSRAGAASTGVQILDAEGGSLSIVELFLDDGAGGESTTATIHPRRGVDGFVVLAPLGLFLLAENASVSGPEIALPMPPLPARQREAGWLDDGHFAYVGSGTGEPIVVVDVAAGDATVSTLATVGSERVYVTFGAVVVSPALPDGIVREYDPTLTESFAFEWPRSPLGPRLMGATLVGGRRWVTNDSAEFRTQTEINAVDATGPTFVAGETILGPVTTHQRGDLVTIVTGDAHLVVVDLAAGAFVRLEGDARSLGLVERSDDGWVTVTREAGATGDVLVFRCVE